MDLSPRTLTDTAAPAPPRRRRLGPATLLAGVLLVGGFIVFQFLTNATVYYCNADEVGVSGGCDVGDRFRLQGTVEPGSVVAGNPFRFVLSFGGARIPVSYDGEPGGIFGEGIPAVVQGRLGEDGVFVGDRIEVKHTEQYREKNPERVPEGAP